jgi:hypothetical protein
MDMISPPDNGKNGAGFWPTPPDYRTGGGVGWLAGARGS